MRNKSGGLDHSELRMAHANKGFRAAQIECLAADFGLVPQFELTGAKRFGEVNGRTAWVYVVVSGQIPACLTACRPGEARSGSVVLCNQRKAATVSDLRIDAACERGRYSLRFRGHLRTPLVLQYRSVIGRILPQTSSRCESS
jgi:hypothetical protein